jgi:hypothetical protein
MRKVISIQYFGNQKFVNDILLKRKTNRIDDHESLTVSLVVFCKLSLEIGILHTEFLFCENKMPFEMEYLSLHITVSTL